MKFKISHIFFVILLLLNTSCGVKRIIKKADKRYELGEYYGAANIYKRAYRNVPAKNKPLRAQVSFRLANCYRLTNNNARAELSYATAIRYKCTDNLVYLYYAEILRINGKYQEALKNYRIYLSVDSTNIWAKNGEKSCLAIPEWKKKRPHYEVKKMEVLNSKKAAEFCPAFANNEGDVLYFNSSRDNVNIGGKNSQITGLRNNDFYIAKKNVAGNWEKASPVEGELNTFYDEGTPSFTSDGKTMYFTRCRMVPNGATAEIFLSKRAGAQWGAGEKVQVLADTTIMVAHPAISPDGKYLYFVSDMKGGYGGNDIWRVQWLEKKWGALENLGPDINTPGDEMFPYVRANGELYFSSNGHPGFGGLDIFKAVATADGKWTVENLMEPINSSANDFGICFSGNTESGMFSSNRKETKYYDKIWSFDLPKIEYIISGKVTDTKSEPLSDVTLRIVGDDGTNVKVRPQKDGVYKYQIQENVNYIMLASCRGYLNSKREISTVGLEKGKVFTTNIQLASISKPVQMNNIFYEFGKWTLTADSEAGLQDLVKMLNDNPNITMEIGAHTDMVGSNEDNRVLSEKRAQSVVDYLIKAGIEKERITPVGYGEDKPVVVDKQMAQKYPFLKENDVLDETFVLTLKPDQQEIVNQINRRTEFKVLKTTYKMY